MDVDVATRLGLEVVLAAVVLGDVVDDAQLDELRVADREDLVTAIRLFAVEWRDRGYADAVRDLVSPWAEIIAKCLGDTLGEIEGQLVPLESRLVVQGLRAACTAWEEQDSC